MALIRYPGSKAKLTRAIREFFPQEMRGNLFADERWEYREPFFGAGAVGSELICGLSAHSSVWINDKDPWMAALWRAVRDDHEQLCRLISGFVPTAAAFYEFKEQDGDKTLADVNAGFRKLALHQMSVSGFGAKSGGPLGGKDQKNAAYPVACRWNPQTLKAHVREMRKRFRKFGDRLRVTCGDFESLLRNTHEHCFIYLDPPYYEKGGQLYKHNMSHEDHERLAAALRRIECPWVLSYDDNEEIRKLYSWASISELEVTYTNATHAKGKRPKNREIVIYRGESAAEKIS